MTLSAAQLLARRFTIGSSDIPAIAGLNPWKGPMAVYLAKSGLVESVSTEQTEIGDELEEPIARMAARRLRPVERHPGGTESHGVEQWATATPDFVLIMERFRDKDERILECKSVGLRQLPHWADGARLPAYVEAQCQWQLEVMDMERAHVAALLGGRELCIFDVARDRDFAGDLLDIGRAFVRRYLEPGIAPPVDGSDAASEYLRKRYRATEVGIVATPEMEDLVAELRAARKGLAKATQAALLAKQRVQEVMGDAVTLACSDGIITWRTAKGGINAWAALKALCADVDLTPWRQPEHRRFTCPWKEDDE